MKKKKWIGKAGIVVGAVVVLALIVFGVKKVKALMPYLNLPGVTNEQLDELNLDKCKKLMIVAHPDDETLWGGFGLIEDDYFVLCITNGDNEVRSSEFEKITKATGDIGLILSYPDKIAGKRSDWKLWKKQIQKDIETVLNYKDWEVVVTHNEKGEYGHQHHIMTHELEVAAYRQSNCKAEQYFFGRYYKKKDLPEDLEGKVVNEKLNQKYQLYKIYESQKKTIKKLSHMTPYENWTKAD